MELQHQQHHQIIKSTYWCLGSMDEIGSLEKIIGGGAGAGGILLLGMRWLISAYFAKAKEVEELKHKNASIQESRLEDSVKNFRSGIDSINAQIKDLSANLTMNRNDLQKFGERVTTLEKLLDEYTRTVDTKVANMIRTEVTNLTKQLMLIRAKKV
jgi:hypothetical protein